MTESWTADLSTRYLFFTGKGGVGKTSLACATAVAIAEAGQRILLVSTDPASNLDEVLGVELGADPRAIPAVPGLFALNIDPAAAAHRYRERAVGPYRGILPETAIRSMEEQLSGACTMEIAAFDEFTSLLGGSSIAAEFDRVIFDTAPTGHTLRLLSLPAAWTGYIDTSTSGISCLGPLAALAKQESFYRASVDALCDGATTTLVLVARPDEPSLREAARASHELSEIGVRNQHLILNGLFRATNANDPVASALQARCDRAMAAIPTTLANLPRTTIPLLARTVVGIEAIRLLIHPVTTAPLVEEIEPKRATALSLPDLLDEIERDGRGVVMTMGKGGVGKTSIAVAVATELARRGHPTLLTTTDPAAHVEAMATERSPLLEVTRIDPAAEIETYTKNVLASAQGYMDEEGLRLLEEDLRSPCTEEIAVFRAFADVVAQGEDRFVVIDTAPTGHTILLMDAAEAYHREVTRTSSETPESVQRLLPRLRDPEFTRILLVALPEPTPLHEAAALQADLRRAGIEAFALILNQSLLAAGTDDSLLRVKASHEVAVIAEAARLTAKLALIPWTTGTLVLNTPI